MRALVFILVLLVPLADLYLLWVLIPIVGGPLLLAWVVLTVAIGLTIFRLAGVTALSNIRSQLLQGRMPGRQSLDDALHVLAGLLLAFPGFITDFLAFPLLIPPTRRLAVALLVAVLRKRFGLPELDNDRPVYTIGPDGRPTRDIEVEIHDDSQDKPHDAPDA